MKHSRVESNRVLLHVVEEGQGPPVVFCHGFPGIWRTWKRQMEAVSAAGYRAIAIDMRGYGQSTAPEDASLYTTHHVVGDLVGLLDALQLPTAALVGHDFGAATVWDAAIMRPDRFSAICGISVPFAPRGEKSVLENFAETGHNDFYMFDRMRPEADAEWADARRSWPANLYWSSAAAPEEERWTLFNRSEPKYRSLPEPLPAWADAEDVAAAVAVFQTTGFHGALNYYRALQLSFDLLAPFRGSLVHQPSLFIGGTADGLVQSSGSQSTDEMRKVLPGLLNTVILQDVGHWPQLEAPEQTNDAIVRFLNECWS